MGKITIHTDKCKGCLLCISFCPKGLITIGERLNRKGVKPVRFSPLSPQRDPARGGKGVIPPEAGKEDNACLGCAMCAVICPDCCIEVYK